MRTVVLDDSNDAGIATLVLEFLDDEAYSPEEIIPGLVQAIILIAEKTTNPEASLDEAANLLADG